MRMKAAFSLDFLCWKGAPDSLTGNEPRERTIGFNVLLTLGGEMKSFGDINFYFEK